MIKKLHKTLVFFIFLGITFSAFSEDKDNLSSGIHLKLKEKNRSSLLNINTEKKNYQPANLFDLNSLADSNRKNQTKNVKKQKKKNYQPANLFDLNSLADSNRKNQTKNVKKQHKPDALKLTILGALGVGVFTAMHVYYQNTWWKDQVTYFKFAED